MTTDLELVQRVRSGDVESFAFLIRRYERSVLAVVQAEVRDPVMAQDIALRTVRRAYRRLANLSDGSQFGPWLLRIARRQTINALRTMPIPVGSVEVHPGSDDRFNSYDPDWIENEHLLGLIARLPEEERRLICLRFFDNHCADEIAEAVGRPVNQVTWRISRAVARLRYWWEWEQET